MACRTSRSNASVVTVSTIVRRRSRDETARGLTTEPMSDRSPSSTGLLPPFDLEALTRQLIDELGSVEAWRDRRDDRFLAFVGADHSAHRLGCDRDGLLHHEVSI